MLSHPFLAATADGSINDDVFLTWLAQDYLFVRESTAFVGVLIGKAPPELRSPLIDALQVLNHELDLFRQQAEAHGAILDDVAMAPTCHAYVQFLMATAYGRSFVEGFTALYGLEKAYFDSWTRVRTQQQAPARWQMFIDNWTSEPFGEYVDWLGTTLDHLTAEIPEADRAKLEEVFLLTARYEYRFWEMALTKETWPV